MLNMTYAIHNPREHSQKSQPDIKNPISQNIQPNAPKVVVNTVLSITTQIAANVPIIILARSQSCPIKAIGRNQ
jgi:hypothetical protein